MRVIKSAKKGGKSHKKMTAKDHLKIKEKAVHKLIENLLAQMKDMEVAAIRYALKQYLGEGGVDITKVKKVREEGKEGYIICYDEVQLGRIHKQHSVEVVKGMPNFRIVFTPFEIEKQTPLKVA